MSLIEQAARRLEELKRAGIDVPWAAAGLSEGETQALLDAARKGTSPAAARTEAARPQTQQADDDEPRVSREVHVDIPAMAAAGFLVPSEERSPLVDEFRAIKRPLLRNITGEGGTPVEKANLIMVTSAKPGEGKTFCAINLALSMAAELDRKVLLVDADVVRPSVLHAMGLPNAPGLLDVLMHPQLDLSEVMLKTNLPKLTVLPAGTSQTNSPELLASGAMDQLLAEIATRYADRIVVFDSPPLLVTTESRELAARLGQIVVVVASGQTSKAEVSEAFSALQACPVVMSVLNKAEGRNLTAGYGYYGS